MLRRFCFIFVLAAIAAAAQEYNGPSILGGVEVQGTHLPAASIIRLLGLKVGQKVSPEILSAASGHVLSTGLVADITYDYRPSADGSTVTVIAKVWDEKPLLPASVFPAENESAMWACLQSADPIFLKELPNTEDALKFYAANMNKCITATSDQRLHTVVKVICDAELKPAKIEFRIEPDGQ